MVTSLEVTSAQLDYTSYDFKVAERPLSKPLFYFFALKTHLLMKVLIIKQGGNKNERSTNVCHRDGGVNNDYYVILLGFIPGNLRKEAL